MASDMSRVWRVCHTRNTWGMKDMVVRVAAKLPIKSASCIFEESVCMCLLHRVELKQYGPVARLTKNIQRDAWRISAWECSIALTALAQTPIIKGNLHPYSNYDYYSSTRFH